MSANRRILDDVSRLATSAAGLVQGAGREVQRCNRVMLLILQGEGHYEEGLAMFTHETEPHARILDTTKKDRLCSLMQPGLTRAFSTLRVGTGYVHS